MSDEATLYDRPYLLTSFVWDRTKWVIEADIGSVRGSALGSPLSMLMSSDGIENSLIFRSNSMISEYRGAVAVNVLAATSATHSNAKRKPQDPTK